MKHVENKRINLRLPQDVLVKEIGRFVTSGIESRQVGKRLYALLPARVDALKREYRGKATALRSQCQAFCDDRYLGLVTELTDVLADSRLNRVEYETHMMLFEARRSLRAFRGALAPRAR